MITSTQPVNSKMCYIVPTNMLPAEAMPAPSGMRENPTRALLGLLGGTSLPSHWPMPMRSCMLSPSRPRTPGCHAAGGAEMTRTVRDRLYLDRSRVAVGDHL